MKKNDSFLKDYIELLVKLKWSWSSFVTSFGDHFNVLTRGAWGWKEDDEEGKDHDNERRLDFG